MRQLSRDLAIKVKRKTARISKPHKAGECQTKQQLFVVDEIQQFIEIAHYISAFRLNGRLAQLYVVVQ
jgi:hypothetical protein